MTVFDPETDSYLERLGRAAPAADWNDVVRRVRRGRRRRAAAALGAAAAAATGAALLAIASTSDVGGPSIVDKAEAAVLAPVRAAQGTIEHYVVQYRTSTGRVFSKHETWIAADGAWCRRTVEGLPQGSPADTRLTECHAPGGAVELYLPAAGEILRARPGAAASPKKIGRSKGRLQLQISSTNKRLVMKRGGKLLTPAKIDALSSQRGDGRAPSAPPEWLRDDVVQAFRRDAVREAGTMNLDGRVYAKLVTFDGRNAVLVDPDTGQARAWIPSPDAFGAATIVVRSQETLPDDAATRRNLSLTQLHPNASIRLVSAAELEQVKSAQYPRG